MQIVLKEKQRFETFGTIDNLLKCLYVFVREVEYLKSKGVKNYNYLQLDAQKNQDNFTMFMQFRYSDYNKND